MRVSPALIALSAGAIGSAAFLLRAFRINGTPLVLILIMSVWVMAPFGILLMTKTLSAHWSVRMRRALDRAMLIAPPAALVIYAVDAVRPFSEKAAAIFVLVPPVSLVLAASIVTITALGRDRA